MDTHCKPPTGVRVATLASSDRSLAFDTLARAFADDPPCRWLWPGDGEYETHLPSFASAFGGAAIDLGTAVATSGHTGVALWMAPGIGPNEQALAVLIERSVPACRQADMFDLFDQIGRAHPVEPHWYLPLIGVAPEWQELGLGGDLLAAGLATCDADGLPAYLEATSSRSIPLYRRHGFVPVGEIISSGCPPIVPMLRHPTGSASR